ncbi:MAG TPA: peptide ABC transporter substrate-binding protein [Aliidongia sp.]|nr:peptide ABC transporter substrate-binding protein [Aliidongia sp.]
MLKPRAVIGLGAACLVLGLAPLPAPAADLAAEQVLRFGNGAEPQSLDPIFSENVQDSNIERDLYEGLVTLDKDSKAVPAAAISWTVSSDGLVYTFKIRPGAKWSNGDPVTAQDFVWSFRRAVNPAIGSKYSFLYYPIKNAEAIANSKLADPDALGVRAIDDQTLEITLAGPTGYFLSLLAHHTFLPQHRATVEKFGAQFTRAGNLVTNGAFMLKEWTPQSRIVLMRNPFYWDSKSVKLAEITYLPIENQNEEFKRYRAGEVDVTNDVPGDQVEFIRQAMPKELHLAPNLGSYYLGMNLERAPFKDNLKLREAINLVIDREAIVTKILRTGELPAYSWVPPGLPGYHPQFLSWKDMPMPERIAMARKLYQEAGYDSANPLKLELRYNTSENHKKIMIAVAAMLRQSLGIETTLVNEEFKVFLQERREKKVTQLFRGGWIADYADPNTFAELMQSDSGLNDSGYASPAYDKLVKTAAMTVDPAKRMDLLEQAERQVLIDLPVVPLYDYVKKQMVKPYVMGFAPNIIGYYYSKDLSIAKE